MKKSVAERQIIELRELWQKGSIKRKDLEKRIKDVLKQTPNPRPWIKTKQWDKNHKVDYELEDHWLAELNMWAKEWGVTVISVCSGHPWGVSGLDPDYSSPYPDAGFRCPSFKDACRFAELFIASDTIVKVYVSDDSFTVLLVSKVGHRGDNQQKLALWWKSIIEKIKRT